MVDVVASSKDEKGVFLVTSDSAKITVFVPSSQSHNIFSQINVKTLLIALKNTFY